MKLLQVVEAVDGRISDGDNFLWNCWGPNIRCLDFVNKSGLGYAYCYYDRVSFNVLKIHVDVPKTDHCWVWYDPDHQDAYFEESKNRNIDPTFAWDDVVYRVVTDSDQILFMLKQIGNENTDHSFDHA